MVLTVFDSEMECSKAEKGADYIRAYDEAGNCIFEADRVSDFSAYALLGGEWSEPEMSDRERIEELEALVAELLFGGERV